MSAWSLRYKFLFLDYILVWPPCPSALVAAPAPASPLSLHQGQGGSGEGRAGGRDQSLPHPMVHQRGGIIIIFYGRLHLDAAAPRPRREEIPKAKTEYLGFNSISMRTKLTELWCMVNWEKVIMMVSLLTWSPQSWFFHRHHDQGRQIWYRCHPELDPFTTPPHADHQFLSIIVPMLLLMKTSLYPYIQGEDHLKNTLYVWAPLPDPCYNIAAFIQIVSIMIIFFF